jgi:hypothetical protein
MKVKRIEKYESKEFCDTIYLSIYLSICLSVCLSIHPSIHLYLGIAKAEVVVLGKFWRKFSFLKKSIFFKKMKVILYFYF